MERKIKEQLEIWRKNNQDTNPFLTRQDPKKTDLINMDIQMLLIEKLEKINSTLNEIHTTLRVK